MSDDDEVLEMPTPKQDEDPEDKHKFKFDDGYVIDYRDDPKVEQIGTEPDPVDGYRPITWKQLQRVFCYERVAHGYKVVGDICQKQREHWERSKQIRVRDTAGGEAAIFFYDDNAPEPNFSWENVEVGNEIEIKSPRLHKFMDGQDGMRVESHKSILRVSKVRFSDDKRLEYGLLNKSNGNRDFELACKAKQKEEADEKEATEKGLPYKKMSQHMPNSAGRLFESAIQFYDAAINHLERTLFTDEQSAASEASRSEREAKRQTAREALAACFLNIAAIQILQKNWDAVEAPCEKALSINASKSLNAKAYFRCGHALVEQGHHRRAEEKLKRADQLNPGDAKIAELLHRIAVTRYEEQKNEKELFQLRQRKRAEKEEASEVAKGGQIVNNDDSSKATDDKSEAEVASPLSNNQQSKMNPNFGVKRSLFGPPAAKLHGVSNFRDVGGHICNDGKTITKRYTLYRSSNLFDATTGAEGQISNDLRVLTEELGIKTIIDLRNQREVDMLMKDAKKRHAEPKPAKVDSPKDKKNASEPDKEKAAEPKKKEEEEAKAVIGPFEDYRDYFTNIKVICAPKKGSKSQASNAFASPTVSSPTSANPSEGFSSPANAGSNVTANKGYMRAIKRYFMFLSGGDTQPSFSDRKDLTLSQQTDNTGKFWLRLSQRQKKVACPKQEPTLEAGKPFKTVEGEIAFALDKRRVILSVDVVTRSFINSVSLWVLTVVTIFFLCFQMKAASKYIAARVVKHGPAHMYKIMVDNQGPEIAQLFSIASNESNYPILITCALGKDRTGVIVSLLLAAADVKFDGIAKDYTLTNEGLSNGGQHLLEQQRELGVGGPEWEVANATDIKELFVHLKTKYGGVHAYLSKIGVTPDQIQSLRRILSRPIQA